MDSVAEDTVRPSDTRYLKTGKKNTYRSITVQKTITITATLNTVSLTTFPRTHINKLIFNFSKTSLQKDLICFRLDELTSKSLFSSKLII